MSTHLLLNEKPLMVLPSLAKYFGINESIILQQIHWVIEIKQEHEDDRTDHDGFTWCKYTLAQWQSKLGWLTTDGIYRLLKRLEEKTIVRSCKPNAGKRDQTKWYRIDYLEFEAHFQKCISDSVQNPISDSGLNALYKKDLKDLNKKDFFFSAENLESSSPEEKKESDAIDGNPEIQETPPPTPAPLRRADSSKIEYADPMGDRFKQSTRRSQIKPLLENEAFISYLKREIKSTEYYKARKVTDGTARDYMRVSYLQNTEGEIRFDKIMDHYTEYQRSQLEATQPTASSDRAPMPERSAVPTHLKNLVKK